VLAVGAVLGAFFVPTPYVLLEPGSVRPAEDRVTIQGAPVYEDDTDVLFTTVFVKRATLTGLLRSRVDDAIEVRTQEEVYGSGGREENRRVNQQAMDLSKLVAAKEALEFVGYDADYSGDGALVTSVVEDAPAQGVIEPGDVIVSLDGSPVSLPADLRPVLSTRAPGDVVTVGVRRPAPVDTSPSGTEAAAGAGEPGDAIEVEVALGEAPDEPGRAVLGVAVQPSHPSVASDVQVEIDSGAVTGPSAGLAWALAVIDRLTPGPLVDEDVAVTGEILDNGRVGVIGGIAQKVATVRRNGVHTFLYPKDTPAEEVERMREFAGDEVDLVPVGTLAEAVEHLAPEGVVAPDAPGRPAGVATEGD
jgi:PDZ domain-containing protein